jgi:branched-chain amino acid transport system substrate-binding protein
VSDERAVADINEAGGIKIGDTTYKLALKVYDHGFDPAKVATLAQKAVNQDGVTFLEIAGGDVIPAAQPITGDDVLILGGGAGDGYLSKDKPMTVRTWYDLADSTAANFAYLKKQITTPQPKVVHLYIDDSAGHSSAEAAAAKAKEAGFESAASIFIDRTATDLSAPLAKALTYNPDVIDFGADPPPIYNLAVKQARQLGYKNYFSFDDTVVESKELGKYAHGSAASPVFSEFATDSPQKQAWLDAQKKLGPLQGWSAIFYDNLYLLKAAMEKAQSVDPKAVAAELTNVELTDGLLGKTRYQRLPQAKDSVSLVIDYPVGEIQPDGSVKVVETYTPPSAG